MIVDKRTDLYTWRNSMCGPFPIITNIPYLQKSKQPITVYKKIHKLCYANRIDVTYLKDEGVLECL